MVISQLINTLSAIMNEYGDINVELYCDPRESEQNTKIPCIDDIKVIKMESQNKAVYLSNEFIKYYQYKDCGCTVRYNPETKEYYGEIVPQEYIEGFNTKFSTKNKFQIEDVFHCAVDEYLDFLGNTQVKRTLDKVQNIIEENDLDYGELEPPDDSD